MDCEENDWELVTDVSRHFIDIIVYALKELKINIDL